MSREHQYLMREHGEDRHSGERWPAAGSSARKRRLVRGNQPARIGA
jgi:hypothetical protein